MATKRTTTPPPAAPSRPPYMLVEEIRVQGYKSLVDAKLHVRPLTLLAGTNSSGKSSIMQPLLLIKQTMEAPYTPAGALVLSGAHVQAETAEELLSKVNSTKVFSIALSGMDTYIELMPNMVKPSKRTAIELVYERNKESFLIKQQEFEFADEKISLVPFMPWDELLLQLPESFKKRFDVSEQGGHVFVENGFLQLQLSQIQENRLANIWLSLELENSLATLMHIPGLRISPKRSYIATYFQNHIKGTFDIYAAGTITQWQEQNDTENLIKLNDYIQRLGLANSVMARIKNANEIELSVNRLPATSKTKPRKADMVNIADVGIGVSQVLPILVALIAAQEGQLVYIEQPELHLHPRAQVVMAELLAEAAKRGVRVIVETHSSLLLLTVQTLVAEGKIKPKDVGLHWFERDAKGATTVRFEEPDENGAYGDWPEDFGDVELTAQRAYLDAVTRRQPKRKASAA